MATPTPTTTDLHNDRALTPYSVAFNQRQMAIIRNQIAPGCTADELAYFLEVCRITGLNPVQRQIYAIVRGKDEKRKMTIQTGIDGYRLLAGRTEALAGIDDAVYDTEDGDHPGWASVTVWRLVAGQRMPFSAKARWREYVQTYDGKPTGMWAKDKMPWLMLGKCAEALALRKAFPAELSGVYTAEEMAQADNELLPYIDADPKPEPAPAPRPAAPAQRVAPTPPASPAQGFDKRVMAASRSQVILSLLRDLDITDTQKQREHLAEVFKRFDDNKREMKKGDLETALKAEIARRADDAATAAAAAPAEPEPEEIEWDLTTVDTGMPAN